MQACIDSKSYLRCSWKYGTIEEVFYTAFSGCSAPNLNSSPYLIKCLFEENTIINTTFTLLVPISTGNNVFSLVCDDGVDASLNIFKAVFVQSKLNICNNATTAMIYVTNE